MTKPHIIFHVGKGGSGKSTFSALRGLSLARRNKKVLVISFDSAHNLADIFMVKLGHSQRHITSGLYAAEIDQEHVIHKSLLQTQKELKQNYKYLSAFNLEHHFDILKYSPGLEEYGLFTALEHLLESHHDFDALIFDMPPTALALKFFNLPFLSSQWLSHLEKLRLSIREKKRIIKRIQAPEKVEKKDMVLEKIQHMQQRYHKAIELLRDPKQTSITAILNPDPLAVSETEKIFTALNKLDIPLKNVVWNKLPPGEASAPPLSFKVGSVIKLPLASEHLVGVDTLGDYLNEVDILLPEIL